MPGVSRVYCGGGFDAEESNSENRADGGGKARS